MGAVAEEVAVDLAGELVTDLDGEVADLEGEGDGPEDELVSHGKSG